MSKVEIIYTPTFLKRLMKLENELQEEVFQKVELFKDVNNHKQLRVHKLKGALSEQYSFSVNYKVRIVFFKDSKKSIFLDIGDHDIYK